MYNENAHGILRFKIDDAKDIPIQQDYPRGKSRLFKVTERPCPKCEGQKPAVDDCQRCKGKGVVKCGT